MKNNKIFQILMCILLLFNLFIYLFIYILFNLFIYYKYIFGFNIMLFLPEFLIYYNI